MASSSSGSSCPGLTDNQKRWLVFGIALNKILVPQIRPFVEQEIDKEYNNLKTSHNIHTQSTSGRLQRWPPRKILKYENINGNGHHPKLPGGKYNFSLFDCRVLSHIDFAKLYVENFMAKFNAFDDHCDASAVLTLLGGVPVFSAAMQAAAGDVRNVRNDWAHCVFSKWDPVKFQQSFFEMEHLVRVMALPAADEAKLLGELKDWETKGTLLCMISPVDPALVQLVQEDLKFLQDYVDNLSVEFVLEKVEVRQELENIAIVLQDWMKQMVESLNVFQGDANERIGSLEQRTGQFEEKVMSFENTITNIQETFHSLTVKETVLSNASIEDPLMPFVFPEKLVEVIRRDYKGAVLCPFPWCEDELQLKLSTIFTRLQINSRKKERSKLTDETVNMTDVFKPHPECDNPRVVLIEGNPGIGKTTYCQKLAYDWSVGEIPADASFSEVKMLLLLKCRDMHMKTANIEEAIDDQLLPQDAGKKEKEDFFHFIRSNQSRVLLVLDGLDELRDDLVQGFLPLIQGKVFANVYLILTSRHEAGMKVRRYCDTLLEIIGYSKDDVESYIKKYFSSHEDQSLADKMIQKLNVDRHLKELTANPLNTTLLCLLCEETRGEFPSKRTKMYDDLVACALRRYFVKRGISLGDEDPVGRCASELNQLGKMAFEALLKNQLYFTQDEMKSPHTVDFLRLPFLSREPSVSKIRPTPTYAFTHKTFQEYFAAFYLAQQLLSGDKGKESLRLDELSPIDNWQVWEFLITMVSSKSAEAAVTVVSRLCAFFYQKRPQRSLHAEVVLDTNIFEDDPYDWAKNITELSGDEEALNYVMHDTLNAIAKCEDNEHELKDYQKKMVHVLARCFPLKKLKTELYEGAKSASLAVYSEYLKFNYSLTDLVLDSTLDPLLLKTIEHVFHSKKKLVHFSLITVSFFKYYDHWSPDHIHWIQSYGTKTLLADLSQLGRVLTHINLNHVLIGDGGTQALAEFLETNRTLTHLNMDFDLISDLGATALGKALQFNSTLTHLSLPSNSISGVGATALATSLKSNSVLLFFDLSKNFCGGDSVALALSEAVKSNCALQYLNLSLAFGSFSKELASIGSLFRRLDERRQMIGHSGGSALARALRFNCTLTYLDLSRNNIGNSGAAALGKALLRNRTLRELYLKDNNIGKIGAVALGKALESNRTLTHLNLQENRGIGNSGAAAIAMALRSNDSCGLTRLDLSGSQIGCSGASHIADALQTNCSLTHLGCSFNEVKSSGASAFAKALHSNRALTHLDLGSNGISDSGATELAQALQFHNSTLVYLDLTGNNLIGSGAIKSLAQVDQSKCIVKYDDQQ